MSRKARRSKARNATQKAWNPAPGPGDVYVREFVSARTGRELRYRNIGEHPLTLAHARGRISDEQFAAAEDLRSLCEMRNARRRDSTDIVPSGGARGDLPFGQAQIDAMRRLARLQERLKRRDWIILEKLCAEGWSMAQAVRAATLCHPSGILHRVHEALDELVEARMGK